jgi:hypothetical protein
MSSLLLSVYDETWPTIARARNTATVSISDVLPISDECACQPPQANRASLLVQAARSNWRFRCVFGSGLQSTKRSASTTSLSAWLIVICAS